MLRLPPLAQHLTPVQRLYCRRRYPVLATRSTANGIWQALFHSTYSSKRRPLLFRRLRTARIELERVVIYQNDSSNPF